MTIPWSAQSQGPPQVGTHVFMYMQRWRKRVKTTERWEREGLASRKRKRMHRCPLHLCTTPGPKNLPWQSTSTPCIQWLKDSLLPKAGPVSSLTTLIFSRPFCCLIQKKQRPFKGQHPARAFFNANSASFNRHKILHFNNVLIKKQNCGLHPLKVIHCNIFTHKFLQ